MGRKVGNQDQWIFPEIVLTEVEKKRILAVVVRIGIEALFSTHLYTFGGEVFLQTKGGPIGLRATCGVARVLMNMWDEKWLEMMKKWMIEVQEYLRYMDDRRMMLPSLRKGWRWWKGELLWKESWEEEDSEVSPRGGASLEEHEAGEKSD